MANESGTMRTASVLCVCACVCWGGGGGGAHAACWGWHEKNHNSILHHFETSGNTNPPTQRQMLEDVNRRQNRCAHRSSHT